MRTDRRLILAATCLALAACGQNAEPPKPAAVPAAAPAASAPAAAPAAEAKKEEKSDPTPEVHGMPGMSELFKDDKKK
jgi:ribosomal protein L12E/L44/L45/RPP1/RPP2